MIETMTPSRYEGLQAAQARERFTAEGPNELPRARRRTPFRIALEVLREPMLAMLLVAGVIYLLLGDKAEALILLAFAGLSIAITIVQEARTERVLEALRDLSAPRALVIRDGAVVRVPGREVVRGDLLVLEPGDRIAADALLLEASEFEADESLLTGESVAVRKRSSTATDAEQAEPGGDDRPHLYAGAIVTRGRGVARVTAIGARSRMGAIGVSLATLEPEAPRLQRETGRVVQLCAIGGIGAALLVVLLYGLLRGSWLDAALSGIAIGMSLLPEEFPVVLTIFLAMGAWRIAQVGVLTRRASAIETLGSATVLCTDKTGTLTQNRMTVSELWLADGRAAAHDPNAPDREFAALLDGAALASAPLPVDPMEVAFHEASASLGAIGRVDRSLVHSYGLKPELLAMSNVWQDADSTAPLTVAAKGAPEAIAQLCRLGAAKRATLESAAQAMAERGMRVLGVATATAGPEDLTKAHGEHAFALLGLIGLSDPLRAGVADAVAECRAAGIRVVMITGDYAATARAIGAQAGLADGALMTGSELAALDDTALAARIRDVAIFARTLPEQKLRIVSALKAAGEVVAMTGDGVNDAPALKAAHIGVAMGKRGTDVAREAASIVLVDDDFGAIVAAIRLGRRIYDNIRKAMSFIFGVHVPIAGLALLPLVTGLPVVFGPIQIALLEMIIDPVCALVFEAEREERDLMRRAPRDPRERLFSIAMVTRSVVEGIVAFALLGALYLYFAGSRLAVDQLRTLTFFALVAAILALVLADRALGTSVRRAITRGNPALRVIVAAIAAVAALIMTVPPIQQVLQFAPLGPAQILIAASSGGVLLVLFELIKRIRLPGEPRSI